MPGTQLPQRTADELLLGKQRWEIPVDEKVNKIFWWFIGHFYTIHFSISCRITESPVSDVSVLLVANRSTSAWYVAYDLGWSTEVPGKRMLTCIQKLYHGIFPYILDIAIFIQNIWEYTMLYSIYIHIVAHVTHGMCFATSVHVCIAVGVGDSWGHDTSPHWELEAQNWKWPWVPNCTCLNGMPLLSWVYLDILKPTDCKYYITICCIYVYIQYYDYYVELFEMGINVPYMEHPIITCFWRGPSKSIDMHSCKIS